MNLNKQNGLPSTFQVILILDMAGISILLIDCLYKKRGNKIEDYCKTELLEIKTLSIWVSVYVLCCLRSIDTFWLLLANDGSVWDFRYLIEQVIKNKQVIYFPNVHSFDCWIYYIAGRKRRCFEEYYYHSNFI